MELNGKEKESESSPVRTSKKLDGEGSQADKGSTDGTTRSSHKKRIGEAATQVFLWFILFNNIDINDITGCAYENR